MIVKAEKFSVLRTKNMKFLIKKKNNTGLEQNTKKPYILSAMDIFRSSKIQDLILINANRNLQ